MDSNNYSQNPIASVLSFVAIWAFVAFNNVLAFIPPVTLDTVQKIAAIICSVIVAVVTVLNYIKKKRR